jgi:hypothetical protein
MTPPTHSQRVLQTFAEAFPDLLMDVTALGNMVHHIVNAISEQTRWNPMRIPDGGESTFDTLFIVWFDLLGQPSHRLFLIDCRLHTVFDHAGSIIVNFVSRAVSLAL